MQLELWILLRLAVAAALGGLVGYERETKGKEAGLRTQMLIAIGTALFASCDDLALEQARRLSDGLEHVKIEVSLLAPVQAVATGIGFLGAGTIFVNRSGNHVEGLTTAASIWAIAAIGLAAGFDRFVLAIGATLMTLIVLRVLSRFERALPIGEANSTDNPQPATPGDRPN